MIDRPGIYTDMSAADYFADCCPQPSLSRSLAQLMLERSPLHVWHAHPRLNPHWQRDDDSKYDLAHIAHKQLIGRGHEIEVLGEEYDSWRTKASQVLRAAALARGNLAVLSKHFRIAQAMVRAALEQLELRGLKHLFRDGDGEVVIAWLERDPSARLPHVAEPAANFWCRQMLDWLTPERDMYVDYKTTEAAAAPYLMPRRLVDNGWDLQAAFAERGLNAVCGEARRRFLFVQQEVESPFCLTVVELSETALTMGRKKVNAALGLWARCLAHDRWPGYPAKIVCPIYPEWAEAQWLEREETEFNPELLMAG